MNSGFWKNEERGSITMGWVGFGFVWPLLLSFPVFCSSCCGLKKEGIPPKRKKLVRQYHATKIILKNNMKERNGHVNLEFDVRVQKKLNRFFWNRKDLLLQFGALCLLARSLKLPSSPWVGDVLVCAPRNNGRKVNRKYVIYRVRKVFLEFFCKPEFLEGLRHRLVDLVDELSCLSQSPSCFFPIPFLDARGNAIFRVQYFIKGWKFVDSLEEADKYAIDYEKNKFQEEENWEKKEAICVSLDWIKSHVIKIIHRKTPAAVF